MADVDDSEMNIEKPNVSSVYTDEIVSDNHVSPKLSTEGEERDEDGKKRKRNDLEEDKEKDAELKDEDKEEKHRKKKKKVLFYFLRNLASHFDY
jgi:hypothetical protein